MVQTDMALVAKITESLVTRTPHGEGRSAIVIAVGRDYDTKCLLNLW